MTIIATILVALPIVVGVYAYLVYPALLWIIARRGEAVPQPAGDLPTVSIVIVAYNEETQIGGAIEAALNQDYPADRRQILIVSDASGDRTDDVVRSYAARGVELLRMPARSGKTGAENGAVVAIRGDIVVNSDASVRLHSAAVRTLVRAMADPTVGVASARNVSVTSASDRNMAEARYTSYEMAIRSMETRAGGIIGAAGAGYAIRASLHWHPVRDDLSRDFSSALTARRHGFRAVAVDAAEAYVPRTPSLRREYRRKVRTISRGMETLYHNRDLLNPFRHGLFSWKLMSHKVSRWMVPVLAIPALVGLCLLGIQHPWARLGAGAAFVLAALAFVGANWPENRPVPRWLSAGVLGALAANLAVVHSAWRFTQGHEDHVWEPTRRVPTVSNETHHVSV